MMKAHKKKMSLSNKSVDSVSLLTLILAFVVFIAVYAGLVNA